MDKVKALTIDDLEQIKYVQAVVNKFWKKGVIEWGSGEGHVQLTAEVFLATFKNDYTDEDFGYGSNLLTMTAIMPHGGAKYIALIEKGEKDATVTFCVKGQRKTKAKADRRSS